MNAKLTLLLRKDVIERAKEEAAERGTSLSRLIEDLLSNLLKTRKRSPAQESMKVSAKVRSLRGIISLPPDYDYKKDYANHLAKKHR